VTGSTCLATHESTAYTERLYWHKRQKQIRQFDYVSVSHSETDLVTGHFAQWLAEKLTLEEKISVLI